MYEHIVAITNSYTTGRRIAWHYSEQKLNPEILSGFKSKMIEYDVFSDISFHKLQTDSQSWSSIVEKDSFFADLKTYDEYKEFLTIAKKEKEISAIDIAKYVLSRCSMSNLKLQKIVYFIYADYLTRTGKKLFDDRIVALQYGPVISNVYDYYKCNGSEEITVNTDKREVMIPATFAKLSKSDDSDEMIKSIETILNKYGSKKASTLVDITHRNGSPWEVVVAKGKGIGASITDDIIIENHDIELM